MLFILTFVVNSLARAAVAGRRQVMTATLDRPVKAPTFQGSACAARSTNNVATVLVTLSVLVALVPLVWVLYTVIAKGISARHVEHVVVPTRRRA